MCVSGSFLSLCSLYVFFFKQKTAYEMRISDWSSDVCSSDLFIRETDRAGQVLSTMVRTHSFHAITEITVLAPDHPRLLSVIAGACAAAGANIADAQIFTTSDGRALDTILINREFPDRKRVVWGKRVSVRVNMDGPMIIKK